MSVVDNQYEDSVVQLVGEGYQDDITLDNITSVFKENTLPEDLEGNMADVNVAGGKSMTEWTNFTSLYCFILLSDEFIRVLVLWQSKPAIVLWMLI